MSLVLIFMLAQLYQPARNKDERKDNQYDLALSYYVPQRVGNILNRSCYNCHSNNTRYSWYDYIQPVRALVESHIKNAKKDLNFNEWGTYSKRKQERLLASMKEQVKEGKMPLPSYTLVHLDAALSDDDIRTLITWIEEQ